MNEPVQLTVEQHLKARQFALQVQRLSRDEAIQRLVELYKTSMLVDNSYKAALKEQWGIGGGPNVQQ